MAAKFIPPRDANFPNWQTKVAAAFNDLAKIVDANTRILPVVIGEPPQLVSDGSGHLIWMEIQE